MLAASKPPKKHTHYENKILVWGPITELRTATQVTPVVGFSPGELRVKTILGVTQQRRDLPFRVPPAQHVKNKIRQCLDVDSYLASSSVI